MLSKNMFMGLTISYILVLLFGLTSCDVEKDKEKCTNQLIGLATCLPYVSGESKFPPMDCCTGFKEVLQKSKECLCLLVKDRNDPSLGFKINATLALSLPSKCNAPVNQSITDCPAVLHLPPNSPDAKVFEDFANSGKKSNATAPPAAENSSTEMPPANPKSDGGKSKSRLGVEMVSWLSLAMVACSSYLAQYL
ncbi:protein YLS3 [Sesamum indicum]|uniref:Protein YLS3 n=1 Tax=Sesamum indicum TaxID=4182 RepID=A0A6I9U743_SESIN|nr:protein YLS3 [Sesamum indicum]